MAQELDPSTDPSTSTSGVTVEVLGAGVLFAASASVTGLALLSPQDPPSALLLLGWPVLAAVGAVVLDRQPGSRVGRTLAIASLGSVVAVLWTFLRYDGLAAPDLARGTAELAAVLAVCVGLAVPCAFHAPVAGRAAGALAVLAGTGAVLVLAARTGPLPGTALGWSLATIGTLGVWGLVARGVRPADRTTRRRLGALLAVLTTSYAVIGAVWALDGDAWGFYVTAAVQVVGALVVGNLWLRTTFRPLGEHLLDLGLVVGTVLTAVTAAVVVDQASRLAQRDPPGTTMVFTALLTAAMAAPAALAIRRSVLARRYGTGLLAPEDVARITADLHQHTQPRDLLDKAARMVATASGSRDARLVLGDEEPTVPDGWVLHPLVVGGDRVGALLVETDSREGPEARQEKVVAQLLPTVGLVARAVGLAVEAEHARLDVAREREAERRRVLGDLHDGLGPSLAGLSMRVQATLRTTTSPEQAALLTDLAAGLATSRTDLRRIVAGITPSMLDDHDLSTALRGLVDSFAGGGGPETRLVVDLTEDVSRDVEVAVYRSVAEGITNALRHAGAATIAVTVRSGGGRVHVEVADDGTGGPVVPGVGLSSLAGRAESLGGQLQVHSGAGTVLCLDLPSHPEVPA